MTLLEAPELAGYHDEPRQMASGVPQKCGVLQMDFVARPHRTVLGRLHRRAPLLVQQALYWDEALPGLPGVYIISTSGGVLQGDRYDVDITLAPNTMAHVTTQSATKVQSMDANFAAQRQRFSVAAGAYFEFLPGPIIPHRHTRFITHTTLSVDPTATALCSEILMSGRKYHRGGEMFEYDLYSSTTAGERPDGTELFIEKFVIEPWRYPVRSPGAMSHFDVLGNVVLLTPPEHADDVLAQVTAGPSDDGLTVAGASRLPNDAGLIFKVLGTERQVVQDRIREFWALVRMSVHGVAIPPKPLWG